MCRAMASPSPLPFAAGVSGEGTLKKVSKTRSRYSEGIPGPWSSISTYASSMRLPVATRRYFSAPLYFTALSIMLISASCTASLSARTAGMAGSRTTTGEKPSFAR